LADIGSLVGTLTIVNEASTTLNQVKSDVDSVANSAQTASENMQKVTAPDYTKVATGISGVATAGMGLWFAYDRVNKAQISLDKANLRVSNDLDLVKKAQEKYNEAIVKFGEDSPEAIQALKDLRDAQEKYRIDTETANERQTQLNTTMMTSALSVIPSMITAAASLKTAMAGLGTAGVSGAAGIGGIAATAGFAAGAVGAIASMIRGTWSEIDKLNKMLTTNTWNWTQFTASLQVMGNPFLLMAEGITEFLKDIGLVNKEMPSLSTIMGQVYEWIQQRAKEAWDAIVNAGKQFLNSFPGLISGVQNAMSIMQNAFNALKTTATTVLNAIKAAWDSTIGELIKKAQELWNTLVGHSLWTDMLDQMQSQTSTALGNIRGDFEDAFAGVSMNVPSMSTSRAAPGITSQTGLNAVTVPVVVNLDGVEISRYVKRLIAEDMNMRSRFGGVPR
jgi:HPt (histidine-containing phosphotransfer) domain-containing protein